MIVSELAVAESSPNEFAVPVLLPSRVNGLDTSFLLPLWLLASDS